MNVQEKMKQIESKKNTNHNLLEYRGWLSEQLPGHISLQKIQVAGTNGKGSTAHWLSALLEDNGWNVGLFTSPHVQHHTERIQINRQPIPESDWERIYDQYASFFEEKELTMFEIDCWMALAWFLEQKVDIAIMEVGLGGRLDATTALDYVCTLITNIGMDHTEVLGDSLEQIAFEKASIFKPGVVALTTEKNPECQKVMELVAGYIQAPLGFVEMPSTENEEGLSFVWRDKTFYLHQPKYQLDNLALALECTQVLGIETDLNKIQPMIDSFAYTGRLSTLREKPLVMADGAHNVEGIRAMVDSLPDFKGQIYFSALREKDVPGMLEILKELNCPITWVSFDNERLYQEDLGLPSMELDTLITTLQQTEEDSLVCGSIYFIGDVIRSFE